MVATAEDRSEELGDHRLAHAMLAHVTDLVAVVDEQRVWRAVAPSVHHLLGYRADELIDREVSEVILGPGVDLLFRPGSASAIEVPVQRRPGDIRWFEIEVRPLPEGSSLPGFVLTGHDVTERRERDLELIARVSRDPLTGLANRDQLETIVTKALHRLQRRRQPMALLFLDLDRFKDINDEWGHGVGDEVLVEVARRLQAVLRDEDLAARTGGDEFVLCCEELPDEAEARVIADRIIEAIAEPVRLRSGASLRIAGSLGVAIASEPVHPGVLLADADSAMYRAKRSATDTISVVHSRSGPSDRSGPPLEDARRRGQLTVLYQPVVRVGDGRVVGAEALLRWQHPRLGMLSPWGQAGGEHGVECSAELQAWIVAAVCRWLRSCRREGAVTAGVSVNVGVSELLEPGFVQALLASVEETEVAPGSLSVEVRDGVDLTGVRLQRSLSQLREAGVGLIVDGFPGPQSSLSELERLRPQALKLDRRLMAGLEHRASAQDLIGGLSAVGRSLGASVVATGVEHAGQEELLRPLGIDLAQGFHFSQPLSGRVFEARYGRDRFAAPNPPLPEAATPPGAGP